MRVKTAWTPSLSPDVRWFAYTSTDAGRYEVYVRPTSAAEGRWQISTEGGVEPVWSASGSELFYRHGDQVLAVDASRIQASEFRYAPFSIIDNSAHPSHHLRGQRRRPSPSRNRTTSESTRCRITTSFDLSGDHLNCPRPAFDDTMSRGDEPSSGWT